MGKMTITDQSQNGTYVNGIRISSNVAVPVTRKDNISFAQISRLDWNLIPNPTTIYKYIVASIAGIALLCLLVWGGIKLFGVNTKNQDKATPIETPATDKKEEAPKEEVKEDPEKKKEEDTKPDPKQSKSKNKGTTDKKSKEKPDDSKEKKGTEKTEVKKPTRIR